jgi:hypothetical protein
MPSGVWVTLHSLNLPEGEYCEVELALYRVLKKFAFSEFSEVGLPEVRLL